MIHKGFTTSRPRGVSNYKMQHGVVGPRLVLVASWHSGTIAKIGYELILKESGIISQNQ